MFPEWPRPAPWSRHLVPFKLPKRRTIIVLSWSKRDSVWSKQHAKGQLVSRQTFQAHERSVSETSVSLSPFPFSFSSDVWSRILLEHTTHGGRSLFHFLVQAARSIRHWRKRDDMPRFGHATPIDTGVSLSCTVRL